MGWPVKYFIRPPPVRAALILRLVLIAISTAINGRSGNLFDPKATIIRAEVAAILYRYLNTGTEEIHTSAFDLEDRTVLFLL